MITAVGFSPAIDITYTVSKLTPGASHKITSKTSKAGGKAVNVASVLKTLGANCQLILPLGGVSGDFLAEDLSKREISLISQKISGATRTCVAIASDQATVLNEPATELSSEEYDEFEELVIENCQRSSVVVFSGSMPANYPPARFQQLIASVKATSNFTIVDSSGEYLLAAATAGADLLKPNSDELAELYKNMQPEEAIQSLLSLGAGAVYLSMGSAGGVYQNSSTNLVVQVPALAGNPTGAGDAFVAGFAKATAENLPLDQALGFASACASAAVLEDTAGEISIEQVQLLLEKVKVTSK